MAVTVEIVSGDTTEEFPKIVEYRSQTPHYFQMKDLSGRVVLIPHRHIDYIEVKPSDG